MRQTVDAMLGSARRGRLRQIRAGLSRRGPLRRLSGSDTSMLDHDRLADHLLGECPWLLVFTGEAPALDELRTHVAHRIGKLPALRDRLVRVPLGLGRPFWYPDPRFDLDFHVRQAPPEYAGRDGWLRFVSELSSVRLDRSRPLWQLWLVPGDGERFGVVLYHHHALADGHSGLHVLRTLFGRKPAGAPPAPTAEPGDALPPAALLIARGAVDVVRALMRAIASIARLGRPRKLLRQLRDDVIAMAAMARPATLGPRPPTIPALNQAVGPRRRALAVELPIEDVRAVMRAASCFPNEIYLTVAASGLGRWLRGRGPHDDTPELYGGVAVNVAKERNDLGNHWSGGRILVPVGPMPELERLDRVRAASRRFAGGGMARGGELLMRLEALLPPQLVPWAASGVYGPHFMNVGLSHMAPPRDLGEVLGRPLDQFYSWTFLYRDHAVICVGHTFKRSMTVNLLVDPDLVPDADAIADGIRDAMRELLVAVGAGQEVPAVAGSGARL